MKTYHIIPKAVFDSSYNSFTESHYIDLSNGNILVCVKDFRSDSHRDNFLSQAGVISLPHPTFETTMPIDQQQVDVLTGTAVPVATTQTPTSTGLSAPVVTNPTVDPTVDTVVPSTLNVTTASTVIDVAKAAGAINSGMRLF